MTIRPPPRLPRRGIAALALRKTPFTLTAKIRSHCASSMAATGPAAMIPALAIRMSRPPSNRSVSAIMRPTSAADVTSAVIAALRLPRCSTARAVSARSSPEASV